MSDFSDAVDEVTAAESKMVPPEKKESMLSAMAAVGVADYYVEITGSEGPQQ